MGLFSKVMNMSEIRNRELHLSRLSAPTFVAAVWDAWV